VNQIFQFLLDDVILAPIFVICIIGAEITKSEVKYNTTFCYFDTNDVKIKEN
jgi:hypothetical protein